ncbi:MAG TPA: dihydrolipoamide acetyltransferase family protein [Solirubrobacteraceae bacterium]|nr:dihydrolipoamide acetyltransferase family protein [Solirubrobacteraceae bacterium]
MATEIVMPRLSDSMEEGTVLQWFVAEGDAVAEGEPLVEVETDKASVTYESEVSGTLLSIGVPAGASAAVGATIAVVGAAQENGAGAVRAAVAAASMARVKASPPARRVAAAPTTRVKASPLARRVAAELGIDLSTLTGTGPQGRVIRADVERRADAVGGGGGGDTDGAAPPAADETTRRPLTRMQQTIARRMAESRATVPDFELRAEVDMTALVALREQLRQVSDPVPSYNDFIIRAAALALREFPRVNGSYRDAELHEHARVNVGIAVAAEDALVVPTIFDADAKSVAEIAAASRELAGRVRDGSITPAELAGSTFSVSNLGMYGVDSFSAVINAPQAAILAVGSLRPRAVVSAEGAVVARNTVNLSLACDHRILYGADGARFLARLRELLEQPLRLLI